jgi:uncharacterized protein YegL
VSIEFDASKFTVSSAKPLPVVLLLDTSASMTGEKIESLNDAVRRMIGTFTKEESKANDFLVSVVTFGGSARLTLPPTSASELVFIDLGANGGTPLGAAIDVAKALIEDKEQTPSRAYRPLVVLVSDGVPTDLWEDRLEAFIQDGRSAKCDRMALGIGPEAYGGHGRATLERFIAGTGHRVFEAENAGEIHNFFKFVTMSVVSRSLSQNPNLVPADHTLQPPASTPTTPDSGSEPRSQPDSAAGEEEDSYW